MNCSSAQSRQIQVPVVSAQQMRHIESCLFADGMPVAALMEKVGGLIAGRIQALYACLDFPKVGALIGPGHNGADALVVARELWFKGYQVSLYHPFQRCKELTHSHAQYAKSLGIPFYDCLESLQSCDLILDGLFGFGLERSIEGEIAETIRTLNTWSQPIVSLDVPSGIHTDTGAVLGIAVKATRTLCLGLWKLCFVQDAAREWIASAELVDFNIPGSLIESTLGTPTPIQRLVNKQVLTHLPLNRKVATHKYQQGHALLIGSSRQYIGSIILSGLGARASGVGMLSIAVPESLKPLVVAQLPDAVVLDCPETSAGAIAHLPPHLDLSRFDAIAYGPGATTESNIVLEAVITSGTPLLIDADGLNLLAKLGPERLQSRAAFTVLTPHAGEFRRLFPDLAHFSPIEAAQQAAQLAKSTIVFKGACTMIAAPDSPVWINTESTPALARGGSGDVLTGLMAGLLAQGDPDLPTPFIEAVKCAVWWHAQAGIWAAQQRTVLGVNAAVLAEALLPTLQTHLTTLDH